MDSEFLSEHEVAQLTRRTRANAQRRVLDAMSIDYLMHPDGVPMVARAQFRSAAEQTTQSHEPDWGAVFHGQEETR